MTSSLLSRGDLRGFENSQKTEGGMLEVESREEEGIGSAIQATSAFCYLSAGKD